MSLRLRELAFVFLRLGIIGFGGPAAHIAMMEEEIVRRRQWLTREKFLDLLGATNLIPGPNSTEMAIHIGHVRAGWVGLIVAGSCFILPAMLIVLGCAWAYVEFGQLPQVQSILYGVKPVIIAIVVQALWSLTRTAVKNSLLAVIGVTAIVAVFFGANELLVLLVAGALAAGWKQKQMPLCLPGMLGTISPAAGAAAFGLWPLFLFFLKIGSVLFGSGYVLLAFLRADLVERWHWLTETQLLDAIAIGQVTPGPVFTTATFIGYILGGTPAAIVATIGIFLPAFVFVAISGPLIPKIRQSPSAGAFLDGVNVGSLALMLMVTCQLARTALVDWSTLGLAALSAAVLIGFRLNSAWLVLVGVMVGLLHR